MKDKWKRAYSATRRFMRHSPRNIKHEHWETQDKIIRNVNLVPWKAQNMAWDLAVKLTT